MNDTPETLLEASRYFADLTVCESYMRDVRWKGGNPICPKCGSERIGEISTRRLLRCKDCRKQFSHKVGTIFEDSALGLDKWFVAVWSVANCKNGISSHELGRAIGVGQKTAWFMLHRIRKAMEVGTFEKFDGVEQVFRFNFRKWTDAQRFRFVLSQVFGRRLTYRLLTAIDNAGFMGIE